MLIWSETIGRPLDQFSSLISRQTSGVKRSRESSSQMKPPVFFVSASSSWLALRSVWKDLPVG